MSTRCQIEFRETASNGAQAVIDRRTIYQHCDGYPDGKSGVIARMRAFLAWEWPHRGFDLEYMPVNYIFWSKCRDIESIMRLDSNYTREKAEAMMAHVGYGVCNNDEFHPDIEFFYEVEPGPRANHVERPTIIVKPYQVRSRNAHVLVRSHFKPLEIARFTPGAQS